jgi:ATP-dependent Lhr-like helicase
LTRRGASFFAELVGASRLLPTQVERALGELAGAGLVTADGFTGLRALVTPSDRRKPLGTAGSGIRRTKGPDGVETAGRWSLLRGNVARGLGPAAEGPSDVAQGFSPAPDVAQGFSPAHEASANALRDIRDDIIDDAIVETQARALLRRYGVVCRRALARESALAPWRDLVRVYRRLEARGEIRGGRFVAGLPGEQFALPEAVGQLRSVRKAASTGALVGISAADPLNLAGVVTIGDSVPALASNRLVYRDGVPLAARESGRVRPLAGYEPELARAVEQALVRRRWPDALKARLHAMGAGQR